MLNAILSSHVLKGQILELKYCSGVVSYMEELLVPFVTSHKWAQTANGHKLHCSVFII